MYPIDDTMSEPSPRECQNPRCREGMIHLPEGLALCECSLRKRLGDFSWIPELKDHSMLDKSLKIMPSAWLVKVEQKPVGRLCLYDVHFRRFILDQMLQPRAADQPFSWLDLSPQDLIDTAWGEGKNAALLRPTILSIRMTSWHWFQRGYDGLAGTIRNRTLAGKITFLACPYIEKNTTFESEAMTEWYQATMEARQIIVLKWKNSLRYFDETLVSTPPVPSLPPVIPLKVYLRDEQISAEQRRAEGIAALMDKSETNRPFVDPKDIPEWPENE